LEFFASKCFVQFEYCTIALEKTKEIRKLVISVDK
jgi:hypothetical protein